MKNNIQKAINEKTIKYYSYCRVGRQEQVCDNDVIPRRHQNSRKGS